MVSAFELRRLPDLQRRAGRPLRRRLAADAVRHVHHDPGGHGRCPAVPQGPAGGRDRFRGGRRLLPGQAGEGRVPARATGSGPHRRDISAASRPANRGSRPGMPPSRRRSRSSCSRTSPVVGAGSRSRSPSIVPAGRLYVGAHFPLDVVGGACLGIAAGAIATFIGGVPQRRGPSGEVETADERTGDRATGLGDRRSQERSGPVSEARAGTATIRLVIAPTATPSPMPPTTSSGLWAPR